MLGAEREDPWRIERVVMKIAYQIDELIKGDWEVVDTN
jgi:hypothetical protein